MCDGVWHCPYGEDEIQCEPSTCSGLFLCNKRNSSRCIHFMSICDGIPDCPQMEDEFMCDLPLHCPKSCTCFLYALSCHRTHISTEFFLATKNYSLFMLKSSQQTGANENTVKMLNPIIWHTIFVWQDSNLSMICLKSFVSSATLEKIDYRSNQVSSLTEYCFSGFPNLRDLTMKDNKISMMQNKAFSGLSKLAKLDLSLNCITTLESMALKDLEIDFLNFSANNLAQIDSQIIHSLRIQHTETQDYRMCCLLSHKNTVCTARPIWPQSCEVMLHSQAIKVITFAEIVSVAFLNIFAIGKSFCDYHQEIILKAYALNVLFMNFNDFLFGSYILALFSADIKYGSLYVLYVDQWLSSFTCKSLGLLYTMLVLNSNYFLTLITTSRFFAIKYPFNSYFKGVKNMFYVICSGICCHLILSLCVMFSYEWMEQQHQMPSSTCLYFGETTHSITIKVTTITIATLQMLNLCFIVVVYFYILSEVQKAASCDILIQNRMLQAEKNVRNQAVLVGMSNVLCWVPSSIIYLISIAMENYPTDILLWNAILINPLNSIINPLLFCLLPLLRKCKTPR